MNNIPYEFSRFHGCQFTSHSTQYLIEAVESDTSQLRLDQRGTTLDPSLERSFELQVFEVDDAGYKGMSGQFRRPDEVADYYCVEESLILMSKPVDEFLSMKEVYNIFADSILTDTEDNLIFGSFWGTDTSVRELQSALTLGHGADGLTSFNLFDSTGSKVHVRVDNIDIIKQDYGRVKTDIMGEMIHLWLYHKDIVEPDLSNCRAVLIHTESQSDSLWMMVKHVCPVPLLDHWKDRLIPLMFDAGMIKLIPGVKQNGTQIIIDEADMAAIIKNECIDGHLTVVAEVE